MCRLGQAWQCNGRYHTGPQMGPCAVEPGAGATTWALARWATLREAQPVGPKQADLITVGQGWSLVPHIDTHIHHQGNPHYHAWLPWAGFHPIVRVCAFSPVWFVKCFCCCSNRKNQVLCGFPCLDDKKLISRPWKMVSSQVSYHRRMLGM